MNNQTATENLENMQSLNESASIDLTVDTGKLQKALGHVQSVVERKNTIAILSNVMLEVSSDSISLTATDLEIAITEKLEANVEVAGSLTVPANTLYDIIRKLPDNEQVRIKGDASESGKILVKSNLCEFSLSCLPANEFPVIEKGDMQYNFELSPVELTNIIDKTRFAISNEETRYFLNGIYFHTKIEDDINKICAVATDGHRLAKVQIDSPDGLEGMQGVIIPRKTILELRKLVENLNENVFISMSDTKIFFSCGNAQLLSKLIDGVFPDYEKVIPFANDKVLEVKTKSLIKSIDRVATIASEKTRAIRLVIESGKLTLHASNEDNGTGNEIIEAEYSDDKIDIGFNSRYLLEMLSGIENETVKFFFNDGSSPALVKDGVDETSLFVVMPMRI